MSISSLARRPLFTAHPDRVCRSSGQLFNFGTGEQSVDLERFYHDVIVDENIAKRTPVLLPLPTLEAAGNLSILFANE